MSILPQTSGDSLIAHCPIPMLAGCSPAGKPSQGGWGSPRVPKGQRKSRCPSGYEPQEPLFLGWGRFSGQAAPWGRAVSTHGVSTPVPTLLAMLSPPHHLVWGCPTTIQQTRAVFLWVLIETGIQVWVVKPGSEGCRGHWGSDGQGGHQPVVLLGVRLAAAGGSAWKRWGVSTAELWETR